MIGDRIKKIRKGNDLTQQEFAEKIGVKRNTVATYEMGRSTPSDSALSLICRTFDISEKWLRTGEGEMLLAKPTAALDALAVEHNLSNRDYIFVEKFLALNPGVRKAMIDYFREVAASISSLEEYGVLADSPAFQSSSHGIPRTMADVDKQVSSFRNNLVMDIQHQQQKETPETLAGIDEVEALAQRAAEITREQANFEKQPDAPASSANESAVG